MISEIGIWRVAGATPRRVQPAAIDLEAQLEDWIALDPGLLAEGLRVVGRQVHVDGGFIDLLGLDLRGRWLVVELKRGRLYREAVAQAIDYTACLSALSAEQLLELLRPGFAGLGDPVALEQLVAEQLAAEGESREIGSLLVGTGVDPGLERVADYLSHFDVPLSIVSFRVFAAGDELLLVREVIEESEDSHSPTRKRGVGLEQIAARADEFGVGDEFREFISAAEDAGLFSRPFVRSVMIAPAHLKNRFLMLVEPLPGSLRILVGDGAFAEFYPGISPDSITEAVGELRDERYTGADLRARLDQISRFLQSLPETLQPEERSRADLSTVMRLASCIRPGEWASYADVSTAAIGRSSAAQSVGNMARQQADFPNPHRLLNSSGMVPDGWSDGLGGGPEVCRERLSEEGIRFGDDGSADASQRVTPEELRRRSGDLQRESP